jgi:hypothetical protein
MERLLRALDGAGEILVLYCRRHDKVSFRLDRRSQLGEEPEGSIDARGGYGLSFSQQQVDHDTLPTSNSTGVAHTTQKAG